MISNSGLSVATGVELYTFGEQIGVYSALSDINAKMKVGFGLKD